jgi:hypothetical protein
MKRREENSRLKRQINATTEQQRTTEKQIDVKTRATQIGKCDVLSYRPVKID